MAAAEATERVLRVRRSDEDDANAFVLVKVTTQGPDPLDLQLVGTEGVNPYLVTIKQSSVRKLRASNYQGTDQQWETLLRHTLLQETPDPSSSNTSSTSQAADTLDSIETVATVSSGQLTLLIRKSISGITQRLGSIALTQADEQEIELFDWAGAAAQSAVRAQADAAALRRSLREQQAAVADLTAQLDDLVAAKQEHEDELLRKFTQLLNAKKLKIRNQQRLLSGARVERPPAATDDDEEAPPAGKRGKGKSTKSTRAGKRKVSEEDPGSDDGFAPAPGTEGNAMDVDDETVNVKEEDGDEDTDEHGSAQQTPELTDTEGEDEDEGGGNVSAEPEGSSTLRASEPAPEDMSLPPKRDLPFARHNLRNKPAAGEGGPADEDEETEDDEL